MMIATSRLRPGFLVPCLLQFVAIGAAGAGEESRTAVMIGSPNPEAISAGDTTPDLAGRPVDLRPGALPDRVRYKFVNDERMLESAEMLKRTLLQSEGSRGPLFCDTVFVLSGAWKAIKPRKGIGKKDAIPLTSMVSFRGRALSLQGMILRDKDEIATLRERLALAIQKDKGGVIRALSSAEMDKWWTFIGFDIEEPTLVLETNSKRHLFVFAFSKDGVLMLDELNNLPD